MTDYRQLPSVERLAQIPGLSQFEPVDQREASRVALDAARRRLAAGADFDLARLESEVVRIAIGLSEPYVRRVINLSGVILHTGLGRARFAPSVAAHVAEVAAHHARVEFDLEGGVRGDRQAAVRSLLTGLTGAEDAHVVNNCAAAVVLSLAATAGGRDVILSRGQMVEIGGHFRMPEVIDASGCRLVEVGTTNRTRLSDYEKAITPNTGALLRCHPSNFSVVGFTESVSPTELAELAISRGIRFIDDAGSGCLIDTAPLGLPAEPTIQQAVAAGPDAVLFSGDKLIGGPQAGLIVGNRETIQAIRNHPLARAFRIDKLSLAALESTLRLYRYGRWAEIPVWKYASRSLDAVRAASDELASGYPGATVEAGMTELGGGSMPGEGVSTWRVGLPSASPDRLSAWLRARPTPVVSRIERDLVWLDPRTAEPDELKRVLDYLAEIGEHQR